MTKCTYEAFSITGFERRAGFPSRYYMHRVSGNRMADWNDRPLLVGSERSAEVG
jgi:hypothetical protein